MPVPHVCIVPACAWPLQMLHRRKLSAAQRIFRGSAAEGGPDEVCTSFQFQGLGLNPDFDPSALPVQDPSTLMTGSAGGNVAAQIYVDAFVARFNSGTGGVLIIGANLLACFFATQCSVAANSRSAHALPPAVVLTRCSKNSVSATWADPHLAPSAMQPCQPGMQELRRETLAASARQCGACS